MARQLPDAHVRPQHDRATEPQQNLTTRTAHHNATHLENSLILILYAHEIPCHTLTTGDTRGEGADLIGIRVQTTPPKWTVNLAVAACFKFETEISSFFGWSKQTVFIAHRCTCGGAGDHARTRCSQQRGFRPPLKLPHSTAIYTYHFLSLLSILLISCLTRSTSTYLEYDCQLARNERVG